MSRVEASDVIAEAVPQPTHTLINYYRPEHVEGTRIVDPKPGPVGRGGGYRVLDDAGYEIDHMREALFARVPTADEVKPLQLSLGEPVVEMHRTTFTADGTVVEYANGLQRHRASRGSTTLRLRTRRRTGRGTWAATTSAWPT